MLTFHSSSVHSLQSIALVQIVAELWNHSSVRVVTTSILEPEIPETRISVIKDKWDRIQNVVLRMTVKLPLPSSFIRDVQKYVYGMGSHVFVWMVHYASGSVLEVTVPKKFCWTIEGCLDEKKTAEFIVCDECIAASERLKLACAYCLEDRILDLSQQLEQEQLVDVMHSREPQYSLVKHWQPWLEEHLGRSLNKTDETACSAESRAVLVHSVCKFNKVACEYFWQNLDPETKAKAAMTLLQDLKDYEMSLDYFPLLSYPCWSDKRSEVLCFLLSLMDEDQQKHVIESHPHPVLKSLLHWPWQCYFMKAVTISWPFLYKRIYANLLKVIINDKIAVDCNDYDYRELLQEFWYQSPNALKMSIEEVFPSNSFVYLMCLVNNEQYVKMSIRYSTPEKKYKLIFSKLGQHIFGEIYKKKNLLEYFLNVSISSRKMLMEFIYYISDLCCHDVAEKRPIWVHLLDVLHNMFVHYVQNGIQYKFPEKIPLIAL